MKEKTNVFIVNSAIEQLVGSIVNETIGVVGMESQHKIKDKFKSLRKKQNYNQGVVIKQKNDSLIINIYIDVKKDMVISTIINSIEQHIQYRLVEKLKLDIQKINIYVKDIIE